MAGQSSSQSEHKKQSAQVREKTTKTEAHDSSGIELLQSLAQENTELESAQPGLLGDPRLQHDNAGELRSQAVNIIRQHGGNAQVQRMLAQISGRFRRIIPDPAGRLRILPCPFLARPATAQRYGSHRIGIRR